MLITVFGASGPSGLLIVERALERGHSVRAFVRDPARMALDHPELELAVGDALDAEAVGPAVAGADSVVSALGIRRGAPKTIVAEGTDRILTAMDDQRVRRFVGLSAHGAGDTRDGSLFSRLTWLALRPNLEDKERFERQVMASPIDWTLVRPSRLTDAAATGSYRAATGLRVGPFASVSRADLADFVVGELENPAFVGEAPTITGR